MKKIFIVAIVAIVILATSLFALAIITHSFQQTLTPPPISTFALYQTDGTTPISDMQNVTALWVWDTDHYILQFKIKNTGNTPLTTSFNTTGGSLAQWTLQFSGNGSLAVGNTQSITITATPFNINVGTTGNFIINVNAN